MGQVPEAAEIRPYLIVGNGRLAGHITHYFSLLKIPFWHWHRECSTPFEKLCKKSSKILVLIKDDAIESFINTYFAKEKGEKLWIHCSGILTSFLAQSAHPLMTFTPKLYDLETYKKIPFITEKERLNFKELFPELQNPNFSIPSELKPLYHAWCSMSGNFSTLLWGRFFEMLESKFDLPRHVSFPYLEKITGNLVHSNNPLTGPLIRNDTSVIEKHLLSLGDDPFAGVYRAFVKTYKLLQKRG